MDRPRQRRTRRRFGCVDRLGSGAKRPRRVHRRLAWWRGIGGSFTDAGGATASNLALVDPVSGHAVPGWDPVVSGPVLEVVLSADGNRLYMGGDFLKVDGVSRKRLAAVAPHRRLDATFVPGAPTSRSGPRRAERHSLPRWRLHHRSEAIQRRRLATMDPQREACGDRSGVNGRVRTSPFQQTVRCSLSVGAFGTVAGQTRSLVAAFPPRPWRHVAEHRRDLRDQSMRWPCWMPAAS